MTTQEFVLILKHIYIREQPHAAQILLDNSIKHKKPQLSYLNRLRPLKATTTNTPVMPTPETLINARADNNQQEQALLLTDDVENELETSTEPNNALSTERITLKLQLMDENKLKRAKKHLEIIKKSERVIINKENEELFVDKVLTGLKASVFLYGIQQQTKKLYNPAFILILRSLKLDEQLVLNKYANVAVQSTTAEQAQQRQRSRGSTDFLSTSTALLSPKKPSSVSSSSKSIKRRKTRRTVADRERERSAQKDKREEGAEGEDSEFYGTPNNDSDSATTENTKAKTKNGKVTPAQEKLLKTKFKSKGPALFGSVQNLKEE